MNPKSDLAQKALTLADLRARRDAILALAEQHGASNVRVFGSVARGEATHDSDVDFLVDWDIQRMTAWGSAALFLELEKLLGHRVDIASESELPPRIRERALRENVPL